jgi:hypothetical protein
MSKKDEAIYIQVGEERVELTGEAKESFLVDRQATADAKAILEAEYEAKKQLRIDAITKLGAASGLSEAEINSILNI